MFRYNLNFVLIWYEKICVDVWTYACVCVRECIYYMYVCMYVCALTLAEQCRGLFWPRKELFNIWFLRCASLVFIRNGRYIRASVAKTCVFNVILKKRDIFVMGVKGSTHSYTEVFICLDKTLFDINYIPYVIREGSARRPEKKRNVQKKRTHESTASLYARR